MTQFSAGDLIEIEIKSGLTYLQVTCLHPSYPEVIRHIEGVYVNRPSDLELLTTQQSKILGMAPIAKLIESGSIIGRKIGAVKIPQNYTVFPTFQMPIRDKQGQVIYWWFWDGDGIWYESDQKTVKHYNFPIREVMTANMLLQRIC